MKEDVESRTFVVSHGLTIAFLLNLIDPKQPVRAGLLKGIADTSTPEAGADSGGGHAARGIKMIEESVGSFLVGVWNYLFEQESSSMKSS